MKSGYNIFWTDHAIDELKQAIGYLEENWTERELKNLANQIENTLRLICENPTLFPESKTQQGVRRVVVAKYNTMYYRVNVENLEIISFFSNRQNPDKRKLK